MQVLINFDVKLLYQFIYLSVTFAQKCTPIKMRRVEKITLTWLGQKNRFLKNKKVII